MFYIDNADKDVLIFALHNYNEIFLKYALRNSIFGSNILTQEGIIEQILKIFSTGAKSELILNVLLFSDFSRWEQKVLRSFLDMIKEIITNGHEQNRILLCYNPVLAICLSSEFVNKIAGYQNIFRHECKVVLHKLMALGDKIVDNLDDDKVEKVFLDTDFRDRTLLKIITKNSFAPLFSTYKVNVLLQEIWVGKNSYECDGQMSDFSLVHYLATNRAKKIPGKTMSFRDLILQNFSVNIDDQKYWYQYKFRHFSISYIYSKDFISAIGMVCLFQYINYQYLRLFNSKQFEGFSDNCKYVLVSDKILEYNDINFYGTVFSATLVFHLITKVVFNMFAKVKLQLDKWSVIDILCSFFNIVCFNVIGKTSPEQILTPSRKENLDYYVIAVVIVSWLRFFGYFLVIRQISRLILTLLRMLYDTLGFIFILCCYMVLAATIFTTLFQSTLPEYYGELSLSLRTLFDAFIGYYVYTEQSNYEMSNSICTMIHVFISNIFLLNYLVAILATVYDYMQDEGEFEYKSNKYEYIEKYSIPILDKHGYSEIILHPPPLNVFALCIVPCVIKKSLMRRGADCFSKFIFWVENSVYIFLQLSYELLLCPYVYLKVFLNIALFAGVWRLCPFWTLWLVSGPFILVFSVGKDLFFYIKILCDY